MNANILGGIRGTVKKNWFFSFGHSRIPLEFTCQSPVSIASSAFQNSLSVARDGWRGKGYKIDMKG
jgi:hypothetical protein